MLLKLVSMIIMYWIRVLSFKIAKYKLKLFFPTVHIFETSTLYCAHFRKSKLQVIMLRLYKTLKSSVCVSILKLKNLQSLACEPSHPIALKIPLIMFSSTDCFLADWLAMFSMFWTGFILGASCFSSEELFASSDLLISSLFRLRGSFSVELCSENKYHSS